MNLAAARDHIEILYGSPMTVISECIRGFLIPKEGYEFIAADLSAIESRKLNWLAGEEDILQIYRTHGKIYEFNAAGIYHIPMAMVTELQRQVGKVAELALGFGGGKGAFQRMAKNYGVKVSDTQAESIKTAWREAHPKVVKLWYQLEQAAISATLNPNQTFRAGRISYKRSGSFLWCQLPSGRVICYPYPEIKETETPWGAMKSQLTYMGTDPDTKKWTRQKGWYGVLVENVVQASSRDVLVEQMLLLEKAGYPIVLHVHDEAVVEIPIGYKSGALAEIEKIMSTTPVWAPGLPLAAKGWRGNRYRK